MEPDPYIQFLENWIPGIGEDTKLHDQLHIHFDLGFSVNDEAKLLGFQLGHHPAGSFFHVVVFCIMSVTIYPSDYRNTLKIFGIFTKHICSENTGNLYLIGSSLKQYYARRISVGRKISPTQN